MARKQTQGKAKKIRVLVGCNILDTVNSACHDHITQLWHDLGKVTDKYEFLSYKPRRVSIDRMRNQAFAHALQNDCKYVLFYDDDIMPPKGLFQRLVSHNKDVICGLTFVRSAPFPPMIFKNISDDPEKVVLAAYTDYEKHVKRNGLVQCAAIGFSTALIKTSVLKRMPKPWCATGSENTEDVYFCNKLRQYKPTAGIWCDVTLNCAHMVDPEPVGSHNVLAMREYYEKTYGIDASALKPDRSKEYVEQCLESLK